MKKRFIALALILASLALVLMGCGGGTTDSGGSDSSSENVESQAESESSSEEEAATSGEESSTSDSNSERTAENNYGLEGDTITVAISGNYEPFTFEKDGENVGYSMDIWKELEARTGMTVEFEQTDFSGLLGMLESGRADVVDAQMSPNPERAEKFAFTQPIDYYSGTVVVKSDNEDINSVEDLKGKTIGTGAGNSMQEAVQENYEEGDINWKVYQSATLDNMLQDVALGRIDGMLAQNVQASVAIQKSGADAKLTEPFEEDIATFVVNKDDTNTLEALDAFIDELKADGTLSKISEEWVGMDISVPQTEENK